MNNNIPQWTTAIFTCLLFAATMILAVVALFQDMFRQWLMRPKLDIAFNLRRPDCQMFPTPEENFFSVRVKNSGRTTAERVEVVVSQLLVRRDDDSLELVDYYLPKNLIWSDDQDIYTHITPEMEKLCRLGTIVSPHERSERWSVALEVDPRKDVPADKTVFDLGFEPNPKLWTTYHGLCPGSYQLVLLIAAIDCPPVKRTLQLDLSGSWSSDESEMFTEGIDIQLV